jgi:hypothetical protein
MPAPIGTRPVEALLGDNRMTHPKYAGGDIATVTRHEPWRRSTDLIPNVLIHV